MRVLVVGEAPSKWMAENGITTPLPLARKELAALSGMIPHQWDQLFECANVLDTWPGKQGKGDAFPMDLAVPRARTLMAGFEGRRVVLLGQRVQAAFGIILPWFEFQAVGTFDCAACPHPSGVNRWWNKAENRRAAAIFWGNLAGKVGAA